MSWTIDDNVGLPVLSFVAANMRTKDWEEISCQLPDKEPIFAAASIYHAGGPHRYAGILNGCPVAVWGAFELQYGIWAAWAYGTKRMNRVVPRITRHILGHIRPDLLARGARRVEIRSLKGYDQVDRWLTAMGCVHECELPQWGDGGETFNLWAWRRDDHDSNVSVNILG